MNKLVHVAVAVIKNPFGKILLSKRADHVHQGGLWEFPGGKVETNETVEQALSRELAEELGIQVSKCRPLIALPHHYADKSVLLDVWEVTDFVGEPHGKEGQPLQWVDQLDLATNRSQPTEYPLPGANFGIVKALRLPMTMAITGEFIDERDFITRIERAIERGAGILQCRLPTMKPDQVANLLRSAYQRCKKANVVMILNQHFNPGVNFESDGVHFNSQQLMNLSARDENQHGLVGASCHNPEQLQQAQVLELDYVCLSPVSQSVTHPSAQTLGWPLFRQWVKEVSIPVYALGGLSIDDKDEARKNGGQGIAAIEAFWKD